MSNTAPTFDGVPAISGTTEVGSTLSLIDTGTSDANGDTVTLSYRWQADGVDIVRATSATYVLTAEESAKSVTTTVTADDSNGGITAVTTSEVTVSENVVAASDSGGGSLSWLVILAGLIAPFRRLGRKKEA